MEQDIDIPDYNDTNATDLADAFPSRRHLTGQMEEKNALDEVDELEEVSLKRSLYGSTAAPVSQLNGKYVLEMNPFCGVKLDVGNIPQFKLGLFISAQWGEGSNCPPTGNKVSPAPKWASNRNIHVAIDSSKFYPSCIYSLGRRGRQGLVQPTLDRSCDELLRIHQGGRRRYCMAESQRRRECLLQRRCLLHRGLARWRQASGAYRPCWV